MRPITEIFVHCTANSTPTRMSPQEQFEAIRRFHADERGWGRIGYHKLVTWPDGVVFDGCPEDQPGIHVRGRNATSLAVALYGGMGSAPNDSPAAHYTAGQLRTLENVLADWAARFPGAVIRGHNEVSAKACPGFNVGAWLGSSAPAPAVRPTATHVVALQRLLTSMGYDPGPHDGRLGPRTKRALDAFRAALEDG